MISIGNNSFYSCPKINNIEIQSSTIFIGNSAFENCNENISNIVLPESLLYIGNYAFNGCSKLKELSILSPKSLLFFILQLKKIKFAETTKYI